MYFKRLEMHGFKSFADPVVIEFHEGVTCIVGPNGSGKSNISDAIRWVLGEQSPKMLRGGKMEEVIFSGTASRKSRGMAEVTLVIDNSTGILPIITLILFSLVTTHSFSWALFLISSIIDDN